MICLASAAGQIVQLICHSEDLADRGTWARLERAPLRRWPALWLAAYEWQPGAQWVSFLTTGAAND